MPGGSSKIYKKSSAFWKHGKHKGVLHGVLEWERGRPERPKPVLYDPKEFFAMLRKKR
jgi:hypothetical protein